MRRPLTTHGPFAALAVASVWLRVAGLDRLPLSPDEAAHAWAAWSGLTGQAGSATAAASPLLFGLQQSLFMAGASDTVARLSTAVIGAAAIAAPWSLRAALGHRVALGLAALLAFDPLSIAWARTATGAALTGTAFWLAMAGGLLVQAGQRRQGAIQSLTALVLGTTSGPLAWSGVPIWLWAAYNAWTHIGGGRRRWLIGAAVAGLALTTTFGTQVQGPGLLPVSLAHAIDASTGAARMPWPAWGQAILADEILPITLAAGAAFTPGGTGTRLGASWLFLAVMTALAFPNDGAWLLAAPAVLLLAACTLAEIVAAGQEPGGSASRFSSAITVVAVLLLTAVHVHRGTGVRLAPIDARPIVQRIHSDTSVRPLVEAVGRRLRADGTRVVAVDTPDGQQDAVLAWYLRNTAELHWTPRLPDGASPSLTIVRVPPAVAPSPGSYPLRHGDAGLTLAVLR